MRESFRRSFTPGGENATGDLDAQTVTVTNRASKRAKAHALERRNHELEVEVRKLNRKIARFELIEGIRKQAAGLLSIDYKSPEFDEND